MRGLIADKGLERNLGLWVPLALTVALAILGLWVHGAFF